MILGLGVDFIETDRVERELSRGNWLPEEGIFTAEEISRCNSARRPAHHYAACFAAKEATLKALGVRVDDLALFRKVEVAQESSRGYKLVLHERLKVRSEELGVQSIRLSIASDAHQTGAIVILEA